MFSDEVNRCMMFKYSDIFIYTDIMKECPFDFPAGQVFCMYNPFTGVSAFPAQVKLSLLAAEVYPELYKLTYQVGTVLYYLLNGIFMA